jgi:glycosyltransferase involved in cell wall biosynthesis
LRLRVWSPLPPSPSGIADYVAEQLPGLRAHAEVATVTEAPPHAPDDDTLDVYHLGNSPAHAFVYRAAVARPGVAFLHEWSLHHLVLNETVERGDVSAYLKQMRRAHGEAGTIAARQVARGLGGDLLPALFPLNEHVLEASLAVVALTRAVARRGETALRGRPVLHLPHHVSLPLDPPPSREEARRALGLPPDAAIVTAPGLATRSKELDLAIAVLARLRVRHPSLRLVVAGGVDRELPLAEWARAAGVEPAVTVTGRLALDDFVRHLAAADVVLALRFPSHGEISGALLRAMGVGRPALVTAGTPAAEEFPEGVVVPIDPGPARAAHLEVALDVLLSDPGLRERIGGAARVHVAAGHGLAETTARLAAFLEEVGTRRAALAREVAAARVPEDSLLGALLEEVRWTARDLGLPGVPAGVDAVLAELAGTPPDD